MFGALKPGFRSLGTLKLVVNVVGELINGKQQLRHRAVSFRQQGFLVVVCYHCLVNKSSHDYVHRLVSIDKNCFTINSFP